jgi:hypothetical protein
MPGPRAAEPIGSLVDLMTDDGEFKSFAKLENLGSD